jgi:hypothetical protein
MVSLDQIMSQWWNFEHDSWEKTPPADVTLAGDTLRSELDSIADFEIEACSKDVEMACATVSLPDEDLNKGREDLQTFIADLKKNYLGRIETLLSSVKKAPPSANQKNAPANKANRGSSYSRPSGGGGIAVVIMFLVGLGLGAGLAFFFRESGRKSAEKLVEEKDKLSSEKLAIMSEYTALQETYFQLAKGKLMTLPELEKTMKPIREEAAARKKQVQADFVRSREGLIKKIPAGDRLDRAVEKLEAERDARLADVENWMNTRLEPYIKQQQIHEDLMQKQ